MLAAAFPIVPVLVLVALIVLIGGIVYIVSQCYNKVPEWRLHPKARKQYKNMKEGVKIWKLQNKYPQAFPAAPPAPPLPGPPNITHPLNPIEQEVVDDIVKDVVDKDKDL